MLSREDIDDVLSVGLYRVWMSRHRYDAARASLRIWFFRIVENAARDVLRHGWHKARRIECGAEPSVLDAIAESGGNGHARPGNCVPESAEAMAIREIVSGLPDVQRRIILADTLAREDRGCAL